MEKCEHNWIDDKKEQERLGKDYKPVDSETISVPIVCKKCGAKKWEYYTYSKEEVSKKVKKFFKGSDFMKEHDCVKNMVITDDVPQFDINCVKFYGECGICKRKMIEVFSYSQTLDKKTNEVLDEV